MNNLVILLAVSEHEFAKNFAEKILSLDASYSIKACFDGTKMLEILEQTSPELIFLDTQLPDQGCSHILSEIQKSGRWIPVVILADADTDDNQDIFKQYGIIDFIPKPAAPDKTAAQAHDLITHRRKRDTIKNFSLPSIMQLIEMEKRTGILWLKIGSDDCRLFFSNGKVMDIDVQGLSRTEARDAFINSVYQDRDISIEYIAHRKGKFINMSLMHVVMEASRIQDEKKAHSTETDGTGDASKENVQQLKHLLESLKEIEHYMISDSRGEILTTSVGNGRENTLNAALFLWNIGAVTGRDLHLGAPRHLICNFTSGRRLIRNYKDYVILLDLAGMVKYTVFKEKLNRHLNDLDKMNKEALL